MCVCDLIAQYFLVLKNIPLPGVPQFISSPTEEHVGYFQVLSIVNKTSVCKFFCVNVNFQLLQVNTKECDCWIIWLGYV